MTSLMKVPVGLAEIVRVYGDPARKDFVKKNLIKCALPMAMRASWDDSILVKYLWIHELVAPAMIDALKEMRDFGGADFLRMQNLDRIGGVHNNRRKAGNPAELSVHAWAIAIDVNPHRGPFGKPTDMPDWIVSAFERRGFVWGGRWPRPDGMHFQACNGY